MREAGAERHPAGLLHQLHELGHQCGLPLAATKFRHEQPLAEHGSAVVVEPAVWLRL